MNTDTPSRTRAGPARRQLLGLALLLASPALLAQVLSPPVDPPAGGAAPALPAGSGAGFHDPRSAFKPLQEIEGVLSWKVLASVQSRQVKDRMVPTYPPAVRSLDRTTVKVQGFMLPLEPGDRQKHFLLSAVPTSCAFCIPAGPEGLIEVRSRTPVKYALEAVMVEGTLAVLDDDPYGLFYRLTDAQPVP